MSYNNVGAGDEQTDATRVGDVPVSVSHSSLFGVASKHGVGGIGLFELGVHVALSPSDCGKWPRQTKKQTVSCYCLGMMMVSDGSGGGSCDVGEPTSHQPVSSLRAVLHPITMQLANPTRQPRIDLKRTSRTAH